MEPDRDSWEYRFGAASSKAMWAIGVPRPIRLAMKWPLLGVVFLIHAFVVGPVRLLRRLANLS